MLPKPGKPPTNPENYRPISLLPALGKIFERIILPQINTDNIPTYQFGFRTGHSTTNQLTRLITTTKEALIAGRKPITISLDIEAAFDKVPHSDLIFKLYQQVQPTWLLQLLQSYYSNRSFRVKTPHAISALKPIRAGTAQGAVISPTLFNIYISDIPKIKGVHLFQFADDTLFLIKQRTALLSKTKAQQQLNELQKWEERWRTKINPTKSAAIVHFRTKKTDPVIELHYQDQALPITTSYKYLGIIIDKNMNFSKHVNLIRIKTKAKTGSLMKYLTGKKIINPETRRCFYNLLIKPQVTYGLPAWRQLSHTNWEKLEVIQRKWARIITSLPRPTPKALLLELSKMKTIKEESDDIAAKYKEKYQKHQNKLIKSSTQLPRVLTCHHHKFPLQ
jgi:hypothetical protein